MIKPHVLTSDKISLLFIVEASVKLALRVSKVLLSVPFKNCTVPFVGAGVVELLGSR